ncbi:MAG: hypothetical protein ACYCY3_10245 [Halothiobacillus sp.]
MMIPSVWSAVLWQDKGLTRLWWLMQGLAALAIGLCGVALDLPIGMSIAAGFAAAIFLWVLAKNRPVAWFGTGYLTLGGERAHWQDSSGARIEGEVRWLWTGASLVGLELVSVEGQRVALWLTQSRVGATAWWQLQQWLRVTRAAEFPR